MINYQSNTDNQVGMFKSFVADKLQRELLKAVISQYEASYVHCSEVFAPAPRDDILPYYRRARIENVLADFASRHESCSIRVEKNLAGNCSHNLLLVGQRIALTQSKVECRGSLPRDAEFRGSYARSPQMVFDFLCDESTDKQDEETVLYGIIAHSPQGVERFPLFVDIVFPDTNYRYLLDKIPLMEIFPDVVAQFEPTEEIIVPEIEQKLQLRRVLNDAANA